MCGINGIWMVGERTIGKKEQRLYEESLKYIDSRGGHATGIYTGGRIIKMPLNAYDFLRVVKTLNRNYPMGNKEILGHTRYATVGSYNDNKNNHPFETRDFVFAHNGSHYSFNKYLKAASIVEQYSNDWPETDSWELIANIQMEYDKTGDIIKAIENALNNGYGAYAFWIYDKTKDKLYLYREDNPLHVVQAKGFVMFASQHNQLPKKLRHNAFLLKPYTLYEIDRTGNIKKIPLDIQDYSYQYAALPKSSKLYEWAYKGYDDGYDSCKYEPTTPIDDYPISLKPKRTRIKDVLDAIEYIARNDSNVGYVDYTDAVIVYSTNSYLTNEIIEYLDELGISYRVQYKDDEYAEIEIPKKQ